MASQIAELLRQKVKELNSLLAQAVEEGLRVDLDRREHRQLGRIPVCQIEVEIYKKV